MAMSPPRHDDHDVDHKYRAKVLIILAAGLVTFWSAVGFVAFHTF